MMISWSYVKIEEAFRSPLRRNRKPYTMMYSSYVPKTDCAMDRRKEPSAGAWVDLPVYDQVWNEFDSWIIQNKQAGCIFIVGDHGVGKSLFSDQLKIRYKKLRVRLIKSNFEAGVQVDRNMLLTGWCVSMSGYVDQPHMENWSDWTEAQLHSWLNLAVNILATQGYRVLMIVEADQLSVQARMLAERMSALILERTPFQGLFENSMVLPPWSEQELATILALKWPEIKWSERVVEELWITGRGIPRELISAANIYRKRTNMQSDIA